MEALTKELEEEKKKAKRLEEKLKRFRPKRPPEPRYVFVLYTNALFGRPYTNCNLLKKTGARIWVRSCRKLHCLCCNCIGYHWSMLFFIITSTLLNHCLSLLIFASLNSQFQRQALAGWLSQELSDCGFAVIWEGKAEQRIKISKLSLFLLGFRVS